jgi:hypothetical protein
MQWVCQSTHDELTTGYYQQDGATCHTSNASLREIESFFNLLAPEFGIQILAHPVCKIRIIHKPKQVALWNKLHFEEEKMESEQHV